MLLCFRDDLEKTSDLSIVIEQLKAENIDSDLTDTVISGYINPAQREMVVRQKLNEFSQYSLVICDRLHAMIFSAITLTPCIAFDNVSKKVSGVYEWLHDLDYIKCIQSDSFDITLVKEMLQVKPIFDNVKFMENFKPLEETIKKYSM